MLPPQLLCRKCQTRLPLRVRGVSRRNLVPGLAVIDYADAGQQLTHAFKTLGSPALGGVMGGPMAHAARRWVRNHHPANTKPLLLVPAPSRPSANRTRGFQPAELLAKEVARHLRALGVESRVLNCLAVPNGVGDQSLLSAAEREVNLAGRVRVRPSELFGVERGRVVLLDDIVTTGATLRGMEEALVGEGIHPEIFLTFAETL